MIINPGTTINPGVTVNGYNKSAPTWITEIHSWDANTNTPGSIVTTVNEGDWILLAVKWANAYNISPELMANLYVDGTNITQLDFVDNGPIPIGPDGFPFQIGDVVAGIGANYDGLELSAPLQIAADHLTEGTETLHWGIKIGGVTVADTTVNILDTSTG
jgi:hypothetical protein